MNPNWLMQSVPDEHTEVDTGATGVPQFIFGNKLPAYSSRWKHSICISLFHCFLRGHLARFCRVESLPRTSRYVVLPDNFPAVCIQQEIIFLVGKKKLNKIGGHCFVFFPQRLVSASGNCPEYEPYRYVFFLWVMLDARGDHLKSS